MGEGWLRANSEQEEVSTNQTETRTETMPQYNDGTQGADRADALRRAKMANGEEKHRTTVKLTPPQRNKLGALLYQHLHNIEGEQFSLYDEGWSDQRISIEIGTEERHVRYHRENDDTFHPLQVKGKVLDADTASLRAWLMEVTLKHNEMVDLLVNRIAHGNTDRLKLLNQLKIRHLKETTHGS